LYISPKNKIAETILKEIKDWELLFYTNYKGKVDEGIIEYLRHKPSNTRVEKGDLKFDNEYRIIGELGYRKNI
jgi:hypothetical protein